MSDDLKKQTELVDLITEEQRYKSSMKLNESMWIGQDNTDQEFGCLPDNYKSFIEQRYNKYKDLFKLPANEFKDALQFMGLEMIDGEVRKKK